MTAAELMAAGEVLFGSRWRTPLAKALGLGDRIIRYYQSGERPISPAIAARVRGLVDIGPVETVIRATVRKVAPEIPPFTAHRIAKQIVADLGSLGMVANSPSCDGQGAQIVARDSNLE